MVDNLDIILRRRNRRGRIDHNLLRRVILRDIFRSVPIMVDARPHFNLENIDPKDVKLNFRFAKDDIPRLIASLRIPNEIRTRSGHKATGIEALCMLLRRLAYPNRLYDMEYLFYRSSAAISEISNFINNFVFENHRHLLEDLARLNWLNQNRLQMYADSITAKGAAVQNCWGFIDGTARAICRPTEDQEEYYSGHKRFHCIKYQSVVCPDGITASLIGAFPGRRHDAGIFRESGLYEQLEANTRFPDEMNFVIFDDQAYGIIELLLCPYPGRGINEAQQNFNTSMSVVRQAVEWSFQKTIAEFAFLDFRKNQKIMLQDLEQMYKTATILTNCHTCLYGGQTSLFFNIAPITLEEYLN